MHGMLEAELGFILHKHLYIKGKESLRWSFRLIWLNANPFFQPIFNSYADLKALYTSSSIGNTPHFSSPLTLLLHGSRWTSPCKWHLGNTWWVILAILHHCGFLAFDCLHFWLVTCNGWVPRREQAQSTSSRRRQTQGPHIKRKALRNFPESQAQTDSNPGLVGALMQ